MSSINDWTTIKFNPGLMYVARARRSCPNGLRYLEVMGIALRSNVLRSFSSTIHRPIPPLQLGT
ncbi:hypothetical protein AG1IA_06887 [Rhizoctonia solani AG-1 IA]|uniref:Uncharacterized protein n=1 Tax=Thanatephorus cucumeris (strain AG1-IA) TaxID=983506 RepID=L8WQN2_THACA|nr:hypothetical protein AG1IA_06887 [Rhizoctonia solani AG-1 IA]